MLNEKQNDPTRAADSQDHRPVQDQSPTDQGFGPNANLDKSHPLREQIQVQPEENFYLRHDGGGWPGDGSGVDDLADFNQMEGADY